MQVVKELAKDAEVPGFRKGKAPLKRVQAHYIKDVRARALARLVDSPPSPRLRRVNIQSALRAGRRPSIAARSALRRRVGKSSGTAVPAVGYMHRRDACATNGSPKPIVSI